MVADFPSMKSRGPAVTVSDVAGFEQRIGARLPEDYREFLLQVNGGRLDAQNRRFIAGVVNMMHSLNDTESEANDLLTSTLRIRRNLPTGDLLYIGYDDGGAPLLLALAGEHRGEVWMQNTWDPRPDDANPRVDWWQRRDMLKLASSFDEFMRSLRPLR